MAMIKRIEELRPVLPVGYANTLKSLPAFDAAEEQFVLPIIGSALYQALQDGYDADTLTPKLVALLAKVRPVIAPFAYVDALPFMQTLITDNGVIAMENEGSRKAFKWEYNNVVDKLTLRGYAAQEALITFLRANYATYPEWETAPYNDPQSFGIIRNGEDLGSIVGLQFPQRSYALLKPLFRMVEDLYIEPLIGPAFYAVLNDRVIGEMTSGEDSLLLGKLRPAVARWALRTAAVELNMRFDDRGFTITDGTRIKDNVDEGRAPASEKVLQRFMDQMDSTAAQYADQAIDYLNRAASLEIFGEWWASGRYTDPAAPLPVPRRNDNLTGIFVFG